ncbi:MAG: hypothetical protein IKD69_15155 [Solobacterium sp.]|nr:hypothetical protein [Solobacterium sp.]
MNRKTKFIMTVIAAGLILLAVILAVIVRGNAPGKDGLIIQNGQNTLTVSWKDLKRTAFTGDIVNGKGVVSHHEYQGMELSGLLSANGIEVKEETKVTAVSQDNYTAELAGAEILTAGKVYAAVVCDGQMIESIDGGQGAQLVVYGDANAKRQVRFLKTITVEPAE